jgi:hypothetical protein
MSILIKGHHFKWGPEINYFTLTSKFQNTLMTKKHPKKGLGAFYRLAENLFMAKTLSGNFLKN